MTEVKVNPQGPGICSKVYIIAAILLNLCIIIFALCNLSASTVMSSQPHIVFILADDMGWNDVSFHGSPQIPTPNLDALAAGGIILNNYYVLPQCTPSRSALLSGRYPFRIGMQHFVIRGAESMGMPLDVRIMPQYMKKLGYATHLVGKWHLGYYKKDFLPTRRGFDSFFGFLNGAIDYYDYTYLEEVSKNLDFWGVDIRNNEKLATNARGKYATDLFTEKAIKIITEHNTSQPLFLFISHLAPHTGNSYMRFQAPPEQVNRFKHIKDLNRRIYAGMMSAMDDSVGKIFQALHSKEMLENSIVIFSSDNGGATAGGRKYAGAASNWPLRGSKLDLWEGAVRGAAAIWSPLLKLTEPRTSMQMMHVTDWLPTLYRAAGGHTEDLVSVDGVNMWEYLIENTQSPRQEIVLNIDPILEMAALRKDDLKLVLGSYPNSGNSWNGPTGHEELEISSMDSWVWRNGSVVRDILMETKRWLLKEPDTWRKEAEMQCGDILSSVNQTCDPVKGPCLFNVTDDPCELSDLADKYPEVVSSMLERLRHFNDTAATPLNTDIDMRGDPRCHGFAFVPWEDEEEVSDCPWL